MQTRGYPSPALKGRGKFIPTLRVELLSEAGSPSSSVSAGGIRVQTSQEHHHVRALPGVG